MLIQLIAHHPEAIGPILRGTPAWVWGLLAALLAVGFSQVRDRTASLARVSVMPLAMGTFSAWGTLSALWSSPLLAQAAVLWLAAAAAALAVVLMAPARTRASYDPASRSYRLPGSFLPLLLVVGIFLVKYVVGVELAMAPRLVQDTQYALTVAGLYGAFSGIFAGRALRLWRLAFRPAAAMAVA